MITKETLRRRVRPGLSFSKKRVKKSIVINERNNLTLGSAKKVEIVKMVSRLPKQLWDLAQWKRISEKDGVSFFRLPNGQRVVVRPEVWVPFPPMIIGKRTTHRQPRRMLTVLNELIMRGVNIESPVAELLGRDGRVYFVTKMEKGNTLEETLRKKPSKENVLAIAGSMGKFLADMHNKGVLHGHPHNKNWLIEGSNARLVDAKGVSFAEEYPWTAKFSERTRTFQRLTEEEARDASTWLNEYPDAQKVLLKEYGKRRK